MQLNKYTVGDYSPGASLFKQILWYYVGSPLVSSYFVTGSGFKCWVLSCFGAKVGQGVRVKQGVKVKFPWRLAIGNFVWIGENSWIDNVAMVTIESNSCISQGVYLCTGNHDWSTESFKLKDAVIHIEEGCWVAAHAIVGPGVRMGKGSVLGLGSVASRSLEPMTIHAGNPAQFIRLRIIKKQSGH